MKSFTVGILVAASSMAAVSAAESNCITSIAKAVSPLFTSADAKACAKAIGGTDMTTVFTTVSSSSDQAKLLASADCDKWYASISTAIKGIAPPCTYIVNDSPLYTTDKFSWTFKEFLVKNNEAGENNTKSTPVPTTTAAKLTPKPTNATNATTTKSPTDTVATPAATTKAPTAAPTPAVTSSASTSAAALTALAVAAYMAN